MNVLVVIGHPNKDSFNHAIANVAVETLTSLRHNVTFRDLAASDFDPCMSAEELSRGYQPDENLQSYIDELLETDAIIIIHPNWWGQPPAILKGWIDRIFRVNVAYRFLEGDSGEGIPEKLLKLKKVYLINTTDTEMERERKVFGDPLDTLWRNCVFGFCADATFHRRIFGIVVASSDEERKKWLDQVASDIEELFTPLVGDE